MGENWSPQRKPSQAQGKHANSQFLPRSQLASRFEPPPCHHWAHTWTYNIFSYSAQGKTNATKMCWDTILRRVSRRISSVNNSCTLPPSTIHNHMHCHFRYLILPLYNGVYLSSFYLCFQRPHCWQCLHCPATSVPLQSAAYTVSKIQYISAVLNILHCLYGRKEGQLKWRRCDSKHASKYFDFSSLLPTKN